jgi:transposase-like protein
MTLNGRRQFWADRIAAQKTSGLNITDWCETHQINRRQFHYWIRNLEKRSSSLNNEKASRGRWAQVNVDHHLETNEPSVAVRVGLATIEIKPVFNPSLLAEVVRVLQTVC